VPPSLSGPGPALDAPQATARPQGIVSSDQDDGCLTYHGMGLEAKEATGVIEDYIFRSLIPAITLGRIRLTSFRASSLA